MHNEMPEFVKQGEAKAIPLESVDVSEDDGRQARRPLAHSVDKPRSKVKRNDQSTCIFDDLGHAWNRIMLRETPQSAYRAGDLIGSPTVVFNVHRSNQDSPYFRRFEHSCKVHPAN